MSNLDFSSEPIRRRRPDNSTGWKILLAFLVVVGVVGVVGFAAYRKASSPWPMPREQFERLVMGKTQKQVIEAIGAPDKIDTQGRYQEVWRYVGATRHEVTQQIDDEVSIQFNSGYPTEPKERWVVIRVDY